MPTDNIYCGVDDVPNGKRRGSMKECLEKQQVRYWGVKKVDSRLLENKKAGKNIPATREKLILAIGGIDGTIKGLKLKLQAMKNPKESEVNAINKKIEKLEKDRKKYKKLFIKADEERRKLAKSKSKSKTKTNTKVEKSKTKTKTKVEKSKTKKKVKKSNSRILKSKSKK